jgi:hypothetical protein
VDEEINGTFVGFFVLFLLFRVFTKQFKLIRFGLNCLLGVCLLMGFESGASVFHGVNCWVQLFANNFGILGGVDEEGSYPSKFCD